MESAGVILVVGRLFGIISGAGFIAAGMPGLQGRRLPAVHAEVAEIN
jgi:hypothetical protein